MSRREDDPFVRTVLERLEVTGRRRDIVDRDARRALVACAIVAGGVFGWSLWSSGAGSESEPATPVRTDPDLTAVWSRMRVPEAPPSSDETMDRSIR